jgi:hypothetical protein
LAEVADEEAAKGAAFEGEAPAEREAGPRGGEPEDGEVRGAIWRWEGVLAEEGRGINADDGEIDAVCDESGCEIRHGGADAAIERGHLGADLDEVHRAGGILAEGIR